MSTRPYHGDRASTTGFRAGTAAYIHHRDTETRRTDDKDEGRSMKDEDDKDEGRSMKDEDGKG
jgi:hypothetical protein